MSKKVVFGLLATALVASLFLVIPAFAQGATPPATSTAPADGTGPVVGGRGRGHGFGHGGPWGEAGPIHDAMRAALAEALGLSAEDFQARIDAGETPLQIAEAQGLTAAEFMTLKDEARATAIQQLLDDGAITQDEADRLLSHMGRHGHCPNMPDTSATPAPADTRL